jgi:NitT/TauT family transport system substrate-binding protein
MKMSLFHAIAAQRSCKKLGALQKRPHIFFQPAMRSGIILLVVIAVGLPLKSHAQTATKNASLKIALLPILDTFPYHVAEAKGYFEQFGPSIEAMPVASGLERDQLMQSAAIDGMLNELISTANFNRHRVQMKTVMSARKAYPGYPLFRLLSAPGSGLTSVAGLAGVAIGISKNTIIEYVTDRLLAARGLDRNRIVKKSVPAIPERYQLLLQGRLRAATLPDPLARSALEAGAAEIIADSSHPDYSVSVLSFSINALNEKGGAVRMFLKAWDRAAAEINANPDAFRALLRKKIRIPKNIQKTYKIPPFPRHQVPNADQWADVMNWMKANGLLDSALPYEDSITSDYLPQ